MTKTSISTTYLGTTVNGRVSFQASCVLIIHISSRDSKPELHIYYSKSVLGMICNRKTTATTERNTETATAISSLPDSNSKKLARFQIVYYYVHAEWCYKPCHTTLPEHNYELKTQKNKKKNNDKRQRKQVTLCKLLMQINQTCSFQHGRSPRKHCSMTTQSRAI